jgi:hypothetical protein
MAVSGSVRHLAHLNVARMRGPMDSPQMAGFVAELGAINALADQAPGFVWRMVDEDPNDPGLVSLGPLVLVNMSLWWDAAALADYVYRSDHARVFKRRGEWFLPGDGPPSVLWWVDAGHIPTLTEAVERLGWLRQRGPTAEAFGFRKLYGADATDGTV